MIHLIKEPRNLNFKLKPLCKAYKKIKDLLFQELAFIREMCLLAIL